MTETSIEERLDVLQTAIQERALRLCDLEIIISDYHEERQRLLQEITALKEQYWDLIGAIHGEGIESVRRDA